MEEMINYLNSLKQGCGNRVLAVSEEFTYPEYDWYAESYDTLHGLNMSLQTQYYGDSNE